MKDRAFHFIIILNLTLGVQMASAQVNDLKENRSEAFRLQNKVKNLLHKKRESQRNILYLQDEIEETQIRMFKLKLKIKKVEDEIKSNVGVFIVSYIKEKNHDLDFDSKINYQIYENWRKKEDQIVLLKEELEKSLTSLEASKKKLKTFVKNSRKLTYRIAQEIKDLNKKQASLIYQAKHEGPDNLFYKKKDKLYWPVQGARLVGSRGFYKIPGERVFDYNEGMTFKVSNGAEVYPIFDGVIEESLDIQELGPLIVVKHTENIRSFYIGAVLGSELSEGTQVSSKYSMGNVQGQLLDLKLRFDTESLDPFHWVSKRR